MGVLLGGGRMSGAERPRGDLLAQEPAGGLARGGARQGPRVPPAGQLGRSEPRAGGRGDLGEVGAGGQFDERGDALPEYAVRGADDGGVVHAGERREARLDVLGEHGRTGRGDRRIPASEHADPAVEGAFGEVAHGGEAVGVAAQAAPDDVECEERRARPEQESVGGRPEVDLDAGEGMQSARDAVVARGEDEESSAAP
ncbi:hypothetical protein GCM10025870_31100 [Agromyces marinus]|uniref:Uncharacterized protein n=1 Tax=Agromyces marinus TaxID=1389020 RepID=A0ABM8H5E6_9MICO|nr:hypothetical protein [Agromyces marinus]BDZ56037.1 hypothetical protein GCM10025870_31100 [Agromyces marinus]